MASRSASRKVTGSHSPSKRKPHGKHGKEVPKEKETPWELQLLEVRKLGQKLAKSQGSDRIAVARIVKTLKDSRAGQQVSLRRTAVEALTPAAAVGDRSALKTQVNALADKDDIVRRSAIHSLKEAAGGRRAEQGGAVAVTLSGALTMPRAWSDSDLRRTGAQALLQLAPKGDTDLAGVAQEWLHDADPEVRRLATRSLGVIGEQDNDVSIIAGRLNDPDWRVSMSAVEMLDEIAGNGRAPTASASLTTTLSSFTAGANSRGFAPSATAPSMQETNTSSMGASREMVRSATTTGGFATNKQPDGSQSEPIRRNSKLGTSASSMNMTSTSSMKEKTRRPSIAGSRLSSKDEPVSWHVSSRVQAATAALTQCCETGELVGLPRAEAVAALCRAHRPGSPGAAGLLEAASSRLTDVDADTRNQAIAAIETLSVDDRGAAVRLTSQRLTHEDWRVRGAASQALFLSSDVEGDLDGICRAAASLECENWAGRRAAASSLRVLGRSFGEEGRHITYQTLVPRLQHTDWSIRRKAYEAVAEVAEDGGGDKEAIEILAQGVKDADDEVRLSMLLALPRAAPAKSKRAIQLAAQVVADDPVLEVRLAAVAAIEALTTEDRSRTRIAIRSVVACLADENEEMREAAVLALGNVGRGRRAAIDGAAELLAHPNENVRDAASRAFNSIAFGVDSDRQSRAMTRIIRLIRHPHPGVRLAATNAVAAFSDPAMGALIAGAANGVARYRRSRFKAAAGVIPEEGEEAEDDPAEALAVTLRPSKAAKEKESKAPLVKESEKDLVSTLLSGDIGKATMNRKERLEEEKRLGEEKAALDAAEKSSSEDELSESDTEIGSDEELNGTAMLGGTLGGTAAFRGGSFTTSIRARVASRKGSVSSCASNGLKSKLQAASK